MLMVLEYELWSHTHSPQTTHSRSQNTLKPEVPTSKPTLPLMIQPPKPSTNPIPWQCATGSPQLRAFQ